MKAGGWTANLDCSICLSSFFANPARSVFYAALRIVRLDCTQRAAAVIVDW